MFVSPDTPTMSTPGELPGQAATSSPYPLPPPILPFLALPITANTRITPKVLRRYFLNYHNKSFSTQRLRALLKNMEAQQIIRLYRCARSPIASKAPHPQGMLIYIHPSSIATVVNEVEVRGWLSEPHGQDWLNNLSEAAAKLGVPRPALPPYRKPTPGATEHFRELILAAGEVRRSLPAITEIDIASPPDGMAQRLKDSTIMPKREGMPGHHWTISLMEMYIKRYICPKMIMTSLRFIITAMMDVGQVTPSQTYSRTFAFTHADACRIFKAIVDRGWNDPDFTPRSWKCSKPRTHKGEVRKVNSPEGRQAIRAGLARHTGGDSVELGSQGGADSEARADSHGVAVGDLGDEMGDDEGKVTQ